MCYVCISFHVKTQRNLLFVPLYFEKNCYNRLIHGKVAGLTQEIV